MEETSQKVGADGELVVNEQEMSVSDYAEDTFGDTMRWYFTRKPAALLTVPLFLLVVLNFLGYLVWGIQDLIDWFRVQTWGAIGVALIIGVPLIAIFQVATILTWFMFKAFPAVNKGIQRRPWKKFWANVGLLLGLLLGAGLARWIVLLIFF